MNITKSALIGLTLMTASLLRADILVLPEFVYPQESARLKKHLKNLERMEADRALDNEHTRLAREEFRKSTVELSGYDVQQLSDVQEFRVAEDQVIAGRKKKDTSQQSYKDAVKAFGLEDPRTSVARENWKESKQAMESLLQSRQQLKESVREGGRLVHNDKTVLSFQKRTMDSDARYRASDDRKYLKEEKIIADEKSAMVENVQSPESPNVASVGQSLP